MTETVLQSIDTGICVEIEDARERVLMITSMVGAGNCAAGLESRLGMKVDAACDRRDGLAALRGRDYSAVIVDDSIAESDPAGADLVRKYAGAAVVLEVNFAISGVARLARDIKSGLLHREREKGAAMRFACTAIESELRTTVAGLLLQSQLALAEPGVSPQLSTKLQQVVQLAGSLRRRLERPSGIAASC